MEIQTVIITLIVILFSMVLHELAHGWVAYKLGDTTAKDDGRLTLNPIKHLDPWMSVALPLLLLLSGGPVFGGAKPVPVDSRNLKGGAWGMALVALAGPMTNFILALIGFASGMMTGVFGVVDGELMYEASLAGEVLVQFMMINIGFGVFNLIPIPPLDGSRILYVLMPDPVRDFMAKMENVGIMIVMVLVVALPGVIGNIMGTAMHWVLDLFIGLV